MATSISGSIRILAALNYSNSVDLGSALHALSINKLFEFSDGTGANAAKAVWSDQRTISASSSENIDLAASLADIYGNTLTFTKVRALYIAASSANTNNVLVGGAASNGFVTWVNDSTDVVIVRPGGAMLLIAPDATGYAVTAATGDILKIANSSSGTSVTYDIAVLGTT